MCMVAQLPISRARGRPAEYMSHLQLSVIMSLLAASNCHDLEDDMAIWTVDVKEADTQPAEKKLKLKRRRRRAR